ncbi:hypothetical protein Sru01_11320 [Sphaerisporangium rufum]|uniref:Transcriptional regulator n=1 Tax=Sphaerisporangium rufum TaxID=1381558 RepID=A0A919R0H0_9ACTN|nr:transcriptional regulator [Sphaerisporangium rufum]GII76150.1 hypothetical protein Sru01_11320 [Sphaerisporangium rufum]
MPRSVGNAQLKAARQYAGYASQQALADALNRAAPGLGLGHMAISVRQVRRWESERPPWPHADHQRLLTHVLQSPIDQLGFTPPWETAAATPTRGPHPSARAGNHNANSAFPLPKGNDSVQPDTISVDFAAITTAYRRLYWTVQSAQLHSAVLEHGRLGTQLLAETTGLARRQLAASLAEALMLVGRIEFFDMRQPQEADATFVRALQAAGEANDPLLGSAILAHAAFVPGWNGKREESAERMRAARTYARRAMVSNEFLAWLDAVEAECETRCGHTREALAVIARAEVTLQSPAAAHSPDWFNWFSPTRLSAFKGNVQLKAGHLPQARETLLHVLRELSATDSKQRTVVLGDLAAVDAAESKPRDACERLEEALDQLALTWYAVGMDRIRDVRRALQPWAHEKFVQQLDDRLYEWRTTLSALQH